MSRCYAYDAKRDTYYARSHTKPLTPAWQAARARRAELRKGVQEQKRDPQGFILKQSGARVIIHDPGRIDRWLYLGGAS